MATLTTAKNRWLKVKGTMAAVVATLMDLAWRPQAADVWVDTDGEEFELRRCDRTRLLDFALRGAAEEGVWKRASRWHLGGGLAGGVDLTVIRRHIRQLRHRGDPGRAAILEMVAGAALWPAARRLGVDGLGGLYLPEAHHAGTACSAARANEPTAPPDISRDAKDSAVDFKVDFEVPAGAGSSSSRMRERGAHRFGVSAEATGIPTEARTEDGGVSTAEPQPTQFVASQLLCPRCHREAETSFHQLWSCPCNGEVEGARLDLLGRARTEHQEFPGFWLRGLVPLEWSYQYCMADGHSELHF